ncbi:NAD(P)-dependent dehydrogenase (short-subunit alcohol dehydrogenase family) [Azomonas macrocytogenes]|uniref:NAD(P)-dependent dehydrogenase (Short-subunit alcohol dehydrogenase family) n=1 Tax=Azomonas macrocytogenes TaxID=69962 RepID=A0A839T851_AZOMA|nr:NAD(P)-dependent dehydrogenase (short-subunit alcohol dehydrogenase family) [Azomonas macrocytogenes]
MLFANAGVVEHRTIDDLSPEHFNKTFAVNVRGLAFTVQKALPLMRDGDGVEGLGHPSQYD